MGWLVWERFACNVNCKDDPDNCISEKLFMQMADHLAADGFKELGYEFINIDVRERAVVLLNMYLLEVVRHLLITSSPSPNKYLLF